MSNLDSFEDERVSIIIPESDYTQKTDKEISLSSEKKSKNLPSTCTLSIIWQHYEKVTDDKGVVMHIKCNFCN